MFMVKVRLKLYVKSMLNNKIPLKWPESHQRDVCQVCLQGREVLDLASRMLRPQGTSRGLPKVLEPKGPSESGICFGIVMYVYI